MDDPRNWLLGTVIGMLLAVAIVELLGILVNLLAWRAERRRGRAMRKMMEELHEKIEENRASTKTRSDRTMWD